MAVICTVVPTPTTLFEDVNWANPIVLVDIPAKLLVTALFKILTSRSSANILSGVILNKLSTPFIVACSWDPLNTLPFSKVNVLSPSL